MNTTRYAIHPDDFKNFGTQKIRDAFLLSKLFIDDEITYNYTHYDRLIVGGAKPVTQPVALKSIDALKAEFFLQRREIGIINVGAPASITVDGKDHLLQSREALYTGSGTKQVTFHPSTKGQALFYYNSAPAHTSYPLRKVTASPWSIHCGAGTSNYSFIWGMAGENLDYNDMDGLKPGDLK